MEIEYKLNTMVLALGTDRTVTAVNREDGLFRVKAGAVILAMGCRERSRGALSIPGTRPAGIYTAGTAQRLVNVEGVLPGRNCVVLGTGDIGVVMARRMTLEGARVLVVDAPGDRTGGEKGNTVSSLEDYGIPMKPGYTVVDIHGRKRVEGVTLARVEDGEIVPGTGEFYVCDTLLLSCGLIPENELSRAAGVALSPVTHGPVVNESLETSIPGVFAAGNVLHLHDLVDFVSQEAAEAGRYAAAYLRGTPGTQSGKMIPVVCGNGVRYTVPECLRPEALGEDGEVTLRLRVEDVYRNQRLQVYADDTLIYSRSRRVLSPGVMETIRLNASELKSHRDAERITVTLEEA